MAADAPAPATTALMRQYLDVKARYPDAIVFFRLGDFYEMFHEDAVYAARVLDLTLTTRDKGKEDPVPMCGIPHHAVRHGVEPQVLPGHVLRRRELKIAERREVAHLLLDLVAFVF